MWSLRPRQPGHLSRRRAASLVASIALATAVAAVGGAASAPATADAHPDAHSAVASQASFAAEMRRLWEDHIVWTRMFIVSVAADLPDAGPTLDRLLRNQDDIGDAIVPFYGEAAGDRLTALLHDHILIAGDLLAAAKAGDGDAVGEASARWYANADEIAAFLAAADPVHWPLADMRAMMKDHLDLTLAEAVARLEGRYADDIAAYDAVKDEILEMADMLSGGIIAAFPSKFAH